MAYGPGMAPMGSGMPHGPILDVMFPRTPGLNTSVVGFDGGGGAADGVRDHITRTLWELGFTPKGRAKGYQNPYPEYYDTIPYPRSFWVPDFAKFTGDDAKTTYEHIGQFLVRVNDIGITDVHRVSLFLLSLTGSAFNWFTFP
jgi:hypothetical protein